MLCAASKVYEEKRDKRSYSFVAKSPDSTNNVMRIVLPAKSQSVTVKTTNNEEDNKASFKWDEASHTCLLKFINVSEGRNVVINW